MVNEALRAGATRRIAGRAMLRKGPGAKPLSLETNMANPKPLMTESSGTDRADAAVQSALRTLDAEGSGIAAISAALQSDLRAPFAAAADLIRNAKGRLIVTGLGKSGHIGRKIAATFASTGTPAFFVHAAEASHGDLGMITADDVILALSWSGEQPEMKNLITYATRFRIAVIAMTAERKSSLAKAADVALTLPKAREACPHNLAPTTSSLMMLALGDALAIALLEGRGFTVGRFQRAASGRQARRAAEIHPRPHAFRRRRAAEAARHPDVRRAGRDDVEGLSAASASSTAEDISPASSPTATCAATWAPI